MVAFSYFIQNNATLRNIAHCVEHSTINKEGIMVIKLHRSGAAVRLMDISKADIRQLATDSQNYACYAYRNRHWIPFNTTAAFMSGGGGYYAPIGKAHKLWFH